MAASKLALNKFIKGVNTDIAEDLLPAGFLSAGHNIKLTNDDNKQGIIQKQESYIKQLNGYGTNLKPLAAKAFKDVIYIISFNSVTNDVEYGSYPSADLGDRGQVNGKEIANKVNVYAPLPNYLLIEGITADPVEHFNVSAAGTGDSRTSTITTVSGTDWSLVSTNGITAIPTTGASGTTVNLTASENLELPVTKSIKFKSDLAPNPEVTISMHQLISPSWLVITYDFSNIITSVPLQSDKNKEFWQRVDIIPAGTNRSGATISVTLNHGITAIASGTALAYYGLGDDSTTEPTVWVTLSGTSTNISVTDGKYLFVKAHVTAPTPATDSGTIFYVLADGTIDLPERGTALAVGDPLTWLVHVGDAIPS